MTAIQGSRWSSSTPVAGYFHPTWHGKLALLLILNLMLSQVLLVARSQPMPALPLRATPVWKDKPVLGYFVFTAGLADRLHRHAGLNAVQFKAVQAIADRQTKLLQQLEQESRSIVQDVNLSLEQKRQRILEMCYNPRLKDIVHASQKQLLAAIGPFPYLHLVRWIEREWEAERKLHGIAAARPGLRTYRIFATRYDSNGAYTVALPDKCLKFANGGNHICDGDGYVAGAGYTVFMSYTKSAAATVGESGPWNVDDNYWATRNDPTPRRKFADLPLGMPEAQAAYFDGYNGGADQFGRTVSAPFGIDLARQVSIDIGLEPGNNDWIDISFLWTDGWDGSSPSNHPQSEGTAIPQPTRETIIPIEVASPKADGSIVHKVSEGQTLWNIAAAYQISLAELLRLNGLTEGSIIVPGQKLLVQPASLTPTPLLTATLPDTSHTPPPTFTPRPSATTGTPAATEIAQAPPGPSLSPVEVTEPTQPEQSIRGAGTSGKIDPILAGILAAGGLGILLFIIGQAFKNRL